MKKYLSFYTVVNNDFIDSFSKIDFKFMKDFYYKQYCEYIINLNKNGQNIKLLKKNEFLKNMNRRKIKFVQLFCPYCGKIDLIPIVGSLDNTNHFRYCFNCGKKNVFDKSLNEIYRFVRISNIHTIALNEIEKDESKDIRLVSYDIFHLEIVELTSILEVILRDSYILLINLKYFTFEDSFLNKIINSSLKNDFMNVDKANNHYKKSLKINLKDFISKDEWKSLIDLCNIRNCVVHNNGFIDNVFKNSTTFKTKINGVSFDGDMIFVTRECIMDFFDIIFKLSINLSNLCTDEYDKKKNKLIANYYRNFD